MVCPNSYTFQSYKIFLKIYASDRPNGHVKVIPLIHVTHPLNGLTPSALVSEINFLSRNWRIGATESTSESKVQTQHNTRFKWFGPIPTTPGDMVEWNLNRLWSIISENTRRTDPKPKMKSCVWPQRNSLHKWFPFIFTCPTYSSIFDIQTRF